MTKLLPLCSTDDVWEGAIRQAALPDGHKIALYRLDDLVYATDDTCSHGAASLSEDGSVEGDQVECSWHNGRFDIRTGAACAMPCDVALRTWPLQIVDGVVCLVLPEG
jgi:nitrite reductase/ring-hydroxylating ferredoxin subunit